MKSGADTKERNGSNDNIGDDIDKIVVGVEIKNLYGDNNIERESEEKF